MLKSNTVFNQKKRSVIKNRKNKLKEQKGKKKKHIDFNMASLTNLIGTNLPAITALITNSLLPIITMAVCFSLVKIEKIVYNLNITVASTVNITINKD